jgi:hypothetical protein
MSAALEVSRGSGESSGSSGKTRKLFARLYLDPDARPERDAWEIAFVVITRSQRDTPLTLPFFSLVTLGRRRSGSKISATESRLGRSLSGDFTQVSLLPGGPATGIH